MAAFEPTPRMRPSPSTATLTIVEENYEATLTLENVVLENA